jgi:hypothetical protein
MTIYDALVPDRAARSIPRSSRGRAMTMTGRGSEFWAAGTNGLTGEVHATLLGRGG